MNSTRSFTFLPLVAVALLACGSGAAPTSPSPGASATPPPVPSTPTETAPPLRDAGEPPATASESDACAAGPLLPLDTAAGACGAWASRVRGRVARSGRASAAVWTKRTGSGLALVVGALHTLGAGAFAPVGNAVPEHLAPPASESGMFSLVLPPADDVAARPLRAASFHFFHPSVPASENSASFEALRPRHDFWIDVMDGQRVPTGDVGPEPMPGDLVETGQVPVHDPDGVLDASPTFGSPAPGDVVAYAGFPRTGPLAEDGAIGFGRVLSDAEARSAIAALGARGDEEGALAYEPEAEMLVTGQGFVGMSGGGVFDASGKLVGVLVRASTAAAPEQYVRAVRLSHVAATLAAAASRLPPSSRATVTRFLPVP